MATYKKRGGKPRNKEERKKATEQESTTAEVFGKLDEGATKAETWVTDNQNTILTVIAAIAVCVLGYLGWKQYIVAPKETEANEEMTQARGYFEQALNQTADKDSIFNLSLHGDGASYGFLEIIDEYKSTKAANRARYYAGTAYLHLGDYAEAIEHLDRFKSKDEILGPVARGAIGDAFVELGQPKEAFKYYKDAAKMQTNSYTTPLYLYKAVIIALDLDERKEALSLLENLSENYPDYEEANTEALLAKVRAMQ